MFKAFHNFIFKIVLIYQNYLVLTEAIKEAYTKVCPEQGTNAKKSYFRGVRILCTAVYCFWAEKSTKDGFHSLQTWNPFSQK